MNTLHAGLLPGAETLLHLHADELPQKDELCGAFWATLALRAAGVSEVDQDAAALAAGTAISREIDLSSLPPGESGRGDFRLELPRTDDPSRSGTAVAGVLRAIEGLSAGALAVVPVTGTWSAASLIALLRAVADCDGVTAIANVATGELWGGRPSPVQLAHYLATGDADAGPAPDWSVGHFVGLVGTLEGTAGTLVTCADTYRSLGWQGLHLQPAERLARALTRSDGVEGGLLCAAPPASAGVLDATARGLGLDVRVWDNGSADWSGD